MTEYYKALIVNNEIKKNKAVHDYLTGKGIRLIYTPRFNSLPQATASHPDMQIIKLDGRNFLAAQEGFEYYKNQLSEYNVNVICGENLGDKYPLDVKLNALFYENKIVCHKDYIDRTLLSYVEKNGIEIIHTRQGYAKCSSVDMKGSVVTSSKPICKVLSENGVRSYYAEPQNIKLDGYGNGFIGGCGGYIGENILFFSGDIRKYEVLRNAAEENKIKIEYIKDCALYDFGGFIGVN